MVEDRQTSTDVHDLIDQLRLRLEQVERQLDEACGGPSAEDTVDVECDASDTVGDFRSHWSQSAVVQTALEATGVAVLVLDAASVVIYVNRAAEKLTGRMADQLQGTSIWDTVVADEDVGTVQLTFAELHAGRNCNTHESTIVGSDGGRRRIAWSNAAISDPRGSVQYIVSSGIDVSERSRYEESLQTELERFRRLIDNSLDLFWEYELIGLEDALQRVEQGTTDFQRICDPDEPEIDLRPVFVSKAVERLLGFSTEQFLSRNYSEHFAPGCREVCLRFLSECLPHDVSGKKSEPVLVELRYRHKDGHFVETRTSVRLVHDDEGFPTRLTGVSTDISREKHFERTLQKSVEQFRALVESTPTAMVVHTDGRIVYANPAAARLTHAESPDQLIGMEAMDLVHPDSREAVASRMSEMLTQKSVAPIRQETLLRLDGTAFVAEVFGVPITYNGKPSIQAVLVDVRQRQRLERQEDELDEFRARLAHLSPRENDVLRWVIRGKPNKAIARQLGISIKTVEHHRANLMKKTGADSVADLVRMTLQSGRPTTP